MCKRTTCKTCGKPSWAGCGAHVEQVLGDVPRDERCRCGQGGPLPKATVSTAAAADSDPSVADRFKSWLRR